MKAKKPFSSNLMKPLRQPLVFLALTMGLVGMLGSRASAAQDDTMEVAVLPGESPAQLSRGMEELVSLDLRSTEATDALKYLATKGSLNIAISKNVAGRVNLFLTDVPIRDVFDLILRSNGLAFDRQGSVYNIMTEQEYRELYGKKFSDLRQVKTFRLQYAIPQQAFNLLDTLKSEIGRILVDEDSGTVMVMDTPQNIHQMEEALSRLEQGGTTRVIDLRYAQAAEIAERLNDQLEVNKLGFVKADERTNQLIVKTFPERFHEVEQLIQALDRKTREVLIDSKIVKVTYSDSRNTGVNWDAIFTNLKFHGIEEPSSPGVIGDFRNSTTGTAPNEVVRVNKIPIPELDLPGKGGGNGLKLGNLVFGTVARDGYELFRYLETLGQTKVISNPRLMVTENKEAKILVGTREAYVTTTTTTTQGGATKAEDVQFIDVGIALAVTPSINDHGFVTMKIKPEVSSVVRTLTTSENNQIPIVDTSVTETTVMVSDGMTVVLGGLRKNEKKASNKQIPWLGHLPVLGSLLFRQVDQDDELSELVIFITPHIVTGEEFVTGDETKLRLGYRDYAPTLSNKPSAGERH